MNKEVEQKLMETINRFLEEGEVGLSALKEKFPVVVENYLQWAFWDTVFLTVLIGGGSAVLIFYAIKLCRRIRSRPGNIFEDHFAEAYMITVLLVLALFTFPFSVAYFRDAIEIKMTPATYMWKELRGYQ